MSRTVKLPVLGIVYLLTIPLISTLPSNPVWASDKEQLGLECYELLHGEHEVTEEKRRECIERMRVRTNIVITMTRRAEDLMEAPASVANVSELELERSAADSISEALRDVPGVEITDSSQPGLKRIRIRGEESRRVAILIDGQEFADEREVGTPLLLAPEMIERIEVLRGPGSVLHGSRAIGGVINIITKKEGYHPIQASASSLYDSATEGYQSFSSVHGLSEGFGYRLAGSFSEHGDRDTPEGELENSSFDNNSWLAYLSKSWDNHKLAFSYDDFNASSKVYVDPIVATTPPFTDFRIDAPQRDRRKIGLFYDGEELTDVLSRIHFDAYYQESEREFNTFSDLEIDVGAPTPISTSTDIFTDSSLDTWGSNGQAGLRLGEHHHLIVGYETKSDDLEQDRRREVTRAGMAVPPELIRDEASQESVELFAEDVWNLPADFELRGGTRWFWIRSELDATNRDGLSPSKAIDDQFVGSVGLRYQGIPGATFWTGWSQGFVFPSMIQLATGAFAGPDFVNPNPDLDAEVSNAYELGGRYASGGITLDTSLFFSEADDYIDHILCDASSANCLMPEGERDRVYDNVDKARSFGAEGSLEVDLGMMAPYGSVSWIRRRFTDNGETTYATGIPTTTGRTGVLLEQDLTPGIHGWADLYLHMADDADELGRRGVEHTAGWMTTNAAFGVDFGEKRQYRFIVQFLNIGDKAYTPAPENLLARGRSAIVKFAVDL